MKGTNIYIKEWLLDKIQGEAARYNIWIDLPERTKIGTPVVKDGYVMVQVKETIKETEKAINVVLETGTVDGSAKGWKTWLPKSQIKMA